MKTTSTQIKHELDEAEINDLAKDLAQEIQNFGRIQNEKKREMNTFKYDLEFSNKKIQDISVKIRDGYYFEDVLCEVEDDYTNKVRLYKDTVTGEVLKSEPFPESTQDSIFSPGNENTEDNYEILPGDEENELIVKLPVDEVEA